MIVLLMPFVFILICFMWYLFLPMLLVCAIVFIIDIFMKGLAK